MEIFMTGATRVLGHPVVQETPPRHPFHRAALTLAEKLANWTFPMIG